MSAPARLTLILLSTVVPAALGSAALADVVHLKNGQRLEGVAVESGEQVAIRSAVGELRIPATLVERIERGESLEDQAIRRLDRLRPNDVQGRLDLAMELDAAGANTLSRRILADVLALDPDHPGARRALGYVRCDDEWLTKDDCHARRGEVLYQGRWISAGDRTLLETLELQRRHGELERLRSQVQLESARLEAERQASATSYEDPRAGGFGYPFDPYYYGGGGAFWPTFPLIGDPFDPFDPIHGGRTGRFDGRSRFDGRRHFGSGRDGRHGFDGRGRHGFDDGRRSGFDHGKHGFRGPLHHRGGQPPRPHQPRHNRSTLAPADRGAVTPPPAGPVPAPRPPVPSGR